MLALVRVTTQFMLVAVALSLAACSNSGGGGGSGAVQKQVSAVERKRAERLRRFRNAPPEDAVDTHRASGCANSWAF